MALTLDFRSDLLRIRSFFHWWRTELAGLFPLALRRWYADAGDVLGLVRSPDRLVLLQLKGAHLEAVGRVIFDPEGGSDNKSAIPHVMDPLRGKKTLCVLCLPADRVLRRVLTLPLAVEENLTQTVRFELDRWTPFRIDQVAYHYRVLGRDLGRKQLQVQLTVVPNRVIEEEVRHAAELGIPVHALSLQEDLEREGARCHNFLPAGDDRRRDRVRTWMNWGFALLALLLLLTLLGLPLWQKRELLNTLEQRMTKDRQAAMEADQLRGKLNELGTEQNFLLAKKREQAPSLVLLDELTKKLPDDTWVQQWDLTPQELQIQGETPTASKLIELFDQSDFFKNPNFKAPAAKVVGTNLERFHISLELKPYRYESPASPEGKAEGQDSVDAANGGKPVGAAPESAAAAKGTEPGATAKEAPKDIPKEASKQPAPPVTAPPAGAKQPPAPPPPPGAKPPPAAGNPPAPGQAPGAPPPNAPPVPGVTPAHTANSAANPAANAGNGSKK